MITDVDDLAIVKVSDVHGPQVHSEVLVQSILGIPIPDVDGIRLMGERSASEPLGQGFKAADMVDMAVSEDDHVQAGSTQGGRDLRCKRIRIEPQPRVHENVPVAFEKVDVGVPGV